MFRLFSLNNSVLFLVFLIGLSGYKASSTELTTVLPTASTSVNTSPIKTLSSSLTDSPYQFVIKEKMAR